MKNSIRLVFILLLALILCGNASAVTPTSDFSATTTSGTTPLNVQFNDLSTGSPTSYAWDFNNDGKIDSTEQNPFYTYNTPGTYAVKLTVTNGDGSDEEIKINYITVNKKPDLIVTSVSGPTTGIKNNTISIDSTIFNQGGSSASNFIVRYLLSTDTKFGADYWIGDVTINNLAAGASLTSTNTFTIPTGPTTYTPRDLPIGPYYILCYIDRFNAINETNENNNILASTNTIVITDPSKSDLTVTSVSGPTTGARGSKISIDSTILNQGDSQANNFTVRYLLSWDTKFGQDYWIGDVTINNLAAGASLTSTNTFTIPTGPTIYTPYEIPAGMYYILCYIDRTNVVNETNETNNILSTVGRITIT